MKFEFNLHFKSNSELPKAAASLYSAMLRIRKTEERIAELLRIPGEIICPVHLYIGQEAVAVGVCANLRKSDYVFSTHRSHGHYIAKGGDLKGLMAELYGRSTGCSEGRGGSMHLSAPEIGLLGSSAIVAGTIPLAAGTALASQIIKKEDVSVVFFGDGATNEGVYYETLNLAVLKKLPLIFVCENNLYSTHLPIAQCLGDTDIRKKAEAFGMPAFKIDGNNVLDVFNASASAIHNARNGKGPAFIECLTYRWLGHVGPNDDVDKGLRNKQEWDTWIEKCPVQNYEAFLISENILTRKDISNIKSELDNEIEEALKFAKESPFPDKNDLLKNVFSEQVES